MPIKKYCKYKTLICTKCGKEMQIRTDYVKKHSGVCMSCQKTGNKNALKHGGYKERLYHIWQGMLKRKYSTYIPSVYDEWKIYENFKKWALENGYADNLTIDRINNKGDYEPNNCQWITIQENAGKDKILFNDDECVKIYKDRKDLKLTQVEMAKLLNISRTTLQRIEKRVKELTRNE